MLEVDVLEDPTYKLGMHAAQKNIISLDTGWFSREKKMTKPFTCDDVHHVLGIGQEIKTYGGDDVDTHVYALFHLHDGRYVFVSAVRRDNRKQLTQNWTSGRVQVSKELRTVVKEMSTDVIRVMKLEHLL